MPLPSREDLEAQVLINKIRAQAAMNPITPTSNLPVCPQCNLLHPPVRPGERCQLTPVKTKDGKTIDFEPFLADLKIMMVSQFEIRKIVNPEEVFKKIKMETMKILEGYKP